MEKFLRGERNISLDGLTKLNHIYLQHARPLCTKVYGPAFFFQHIFQWLIPSPIFPSRISLS